MDPALPWTQERIDQLKRMHADGSTASEIAAALGRVTRNAVIGKIHRLGLHRSVAKKPVAVAPLKAVDPQRIHPGYIARKASKKAEERHEAFLAIADKALDRFDAAVTPSGNPVRFLDRGHFQCAMPQPGWDDATVTHKMVCGQPVQAGTSWCPACLKIIAAPSALASFKNRKTMEGVAA
jgi:hypothetical protein